MEQKEYWDSVADEKTFTTPFQKDLFVEYVSKNDGSWRWDADTEERWRSCISWV